MTAGPMLPFGDNVRLPFTVQEEGTTIFEATVTPVVEPEHDPDISSGFALNICFKAPLTFVCTVLKDFNAPPELTDISVSAFNVPFTFAVMPIITPPNIFRTNNRRDMTK
jgi:hypothetical protein